ncbi:competence/damage-inducible protein A [Kurthia sibirica]|uniref:Putative competence-damage inducible protein n=1 Tax=Kurthia sibirica TaxID=202750 RepID=A0A2U3AQX5_9BACL|nr:competence/damage-inducible protein A [Kurthia sibirica]PWI26958.1 competence/damage-inducible protein A [Kurthia sibirica]GEK32496.1 putative competence-damage inducible protein [Kurthia sibirica]
MNAEIIAVGSELLLGQINNTNARFISSQLTELGINVYYHTVVGDNAGRLEEIIVRAEERADLLIFTGGLGPTKDDLTKETIAKHLGTTLKQNDDAMNMIEGFFAKRNRPMTENNRKQALVLKDCEVLENANGMAPGMFLEQEGRIYILLPGPPKEMEPMFQFEAKPKLARLVSDGGLIVSHVLRFYGIGEAELEERVQHLLEEQTNPTIAPLAGDGEVTLRITAKANTEDEAWALITPVREQILTAAGDYLYGVNDESLASKLANMLIDHNLTIAAAESLTAGLFQSELATVPGIGEVLYGGMVTYNEDMKVNQLGVPKELIERYTVVSAECAASMAINIKEKFGSQIGVSLTGAAGPGPHANHPVGTVWIGIVFGDDEPVTYELHLQGMRNTNRIRAVKTAIYRVIQLLSDKGYRKI